MTRIATLGFAALTLLYPFAIYFGSQLTSPRYLVLALLCVAGLRLLGWQLGGFWARAGWLALIGGLAALSLWRNSDVGLRLYPVAVNASLLLVFFTSLFGRQTLVEQLARLKEPQLPPAAVVYTRRVTQVWCAFFVVNGGIACYTALWASQEIWLLYNGLIAYGLMGLVAGAEWLVRRRLQARALGQGCA